MYAKFGNDNGQFAYGIGSCIGAGAGSLSSGKGLEQLITTIYRVKKHLNPQIQFEGILISMLNARTNYAKDIMELIKKYYGESIPIFESKIPFSVKAAETSATGVSIFTLDKKHPVAHAYEKLTKEVIAHE